MAWAENELRREPYEPIDAHRPRYGTSDERKLALSETLVWGWSVLIVLGAAFGIHEILAQGTLSPTTLLAALGAALLIGATEFHIVCNVLPAKATPKTLPIIATIVCAGLLFVFNHVAIVSALGTSQHAHDSWVRGVTASSAAVSRRLQSVEHSLEQLIGTQYEPRGEEDFSNGPGTADTSDKSELSAVLGRWSDSLTALSTPLETAIDAFARRHGAVEPDAAVEKARHIANALANFNRQLASETTDTGLAGYLQRPDLLGNTDGQRHLRDIAGGLRALGAVRIALPGADRSAGIGALERLGVGISQLFGSDVPQTRGLTTRDYIGLVASALAVLFVLLLQANRWRFRLPDLPDPPDSLSAGAGKN